MFPAKFDLSYFLEVTATRNIHRAAERNGIGQLFLSMALKRLEGVIAAPSDSGEVRGAVDESGSTPSPEN